MPVSSENEMDRLRKCNKQPYEDWLTFMRRFVNEAALYNSVSSASKTRILFIKLPTQFKKKCVTFLPHVHYKI